MFIFEIEACSNASVLGVILFIKNLINVLRVIIPVLLLLFLSIDVFQAVVMGNEDKSTKIKNIALKRIIYAVAIFFVPIIVNATFLLLEDKNIIKSSCYTDATSEKVQQLADESKKLREQEQQKNQEARKALEEKMVERNKQLEQKRSDSRSKTSKASESSKASKNSSSNKKKGKVKTIGNTYVGKAKKNKTYKANKILDKITKKDFYQRITVTSTNKEKVAQSFAVVGDYFVVTFVNNSHNSAYVGVYNKYTGAKVNKFHASLGHANGMTHNASDNNLYVTHGGLSNRKVHKFSANSIDTKENLKVGSITVPRGVSGAAYDDSTGKMYFASGSNIFQYTSDNMSYKVNRRNYVRNSSQDFCVNGGIVYDLRNNGDALDMFRVDDGAYLGSYKISINSHELESIDYYGEGEKMAILFNNYGSKNNYIYIIDSIVPK